MTADPDELERTRAQGRQDAEALASTHAPDDSLLRIAWADGAEDADHLREAVTRARDAGATWNAVAEVLGISANTARSRFSAGGYDRIRRYRARKRSEG